MAEIEEEVVFFTKADQIKFNTQTNGDKIIMSGFHLTKEQAATMAWLVNTSDNSELKIKIKVK